MDDILLGSISLALGLLLGFIGGRHQRDVDDAALFPVDDATQTDLAPPESRFGDCAIRNFVFDGSDSIRREVQIHFTCDHVDDRSHKSVSKMADKRLKAMAPDGVSHRLVTIRDSRHEV